MNARGILKELGKRIMLWGLGGFAVGTLGSNVAGFANPVAEALSTQISLLAYLGVAAFVIGLILNLAGAKPASPADTSDSVNPIVSPDSAGAGELSEPAVAVAAAESKARSQAGTTMVVVGLAICLLPLFLGIFSPVYLWLMFFAVPIGGVVLIAGFVQTNRSAK